MHTATTCTRNQRNIFETKRKQIIIYGKIIYLGLVEKRSVTRVFLSVSPGSSQPSSDHDYMKMALSTCQKRKIMTNKIGSTASRNKDSTLEQKVTAKSLYPIKEKDSISGFNNV